ncbi:MAG TPA: DUF4082 domain-containing protein, partial [Chloroflexota bacterium]
LTVADKDGGVGTATTSITATNVAPSGLIRNLNVSWTSIGEGDTVTVSGSFVDPGSADTHTLVIDWGNQDPPTTLNLAAGVLTYSASHPYLDDNPTATFSDGSAITVTVTDKDGASHSASRAITVFNEPPWVGALTGPTGPVRLNASATFSASFTDLGVLDTHVATFNWGDGKTSGGTVVEANGAGTVTGTHAYSAVGVYNVRVTVTDDDTGSATSAPRSITVTVDGAPDTTPPTVTNVQATWITTTTATITWTTNETADTQIDYGTSTTPYSSSTALDPTLVTSHSQVLTGLTANTLYHYRVRSKDYFNNQTVSPDYTFRTAAVATCQCSIWSGSPTPVVPNDADATGIEVGVKFRTNQPGRIRAIRFYKGPANTSTHTVHLWSRTGTLLASAVSTGESASGWQQVTFAAPVAIAANTTYVASYHSPAGRYSYTDAYFGAAITNGPLTALKDGADGGNGVYRYTTTGAFPNLPYNAGNYWVDVVFTSS